MKLAKLIIAIALLYPIALCAQTVEIMSYNVRNGRGMDGLCDLDRTSSVIKESKVQLVALQELDSITRRSGGIDVLRELAVRCSMHPTYARAIAYDGGAYGVGLLSKDKPTKVKRVALPGREEARVLLIAEFADYVIFATHFSLTAQDQTSSIALIAQLAEKYDKKPLFLVGDLNLEPRSEQFEQLSNHFTLLSDPAKPTFPADEPTQTIDYVYGSKACKYKVHRATVIEAPSQSDHRPIVVRLTSSKK